MPPRSLQQEQMHRLEQIVLPHYMQWSMYAVAIKQGAFLPMKAITSLSAKRDSHDISVKTPNTYSSQLTALPICKFLHVRGPAAGAKPYNIQNTLPDKHPNTSPMHDCVSRWRRLPKRNVSTAWFWCWCFLLFDQFQVLSWLMYLKP